MSFEEFYILCEFYKRMQLYYGGTKHGRQQGNELKLFCCKNVMKREREYWEEIRSSVVAIYE
jgi:hypothetical protein